MADKKKKTFRLHTTYAQRQNIRGYLFMLPWILGFIVFSLIPFGATVVLSFTNVSSTVMGFEITPAGWSNYYTAFFRNTEFVPALLGFIAPSLILPFIF